MARIIQCVYFAFVLLLCAAICSCNNMNKVKDKMKKAKPVAPLQGVYYSIFVRSFADSNGDGIGDLNGITEKLDYLESLGITGIWLMPVYPSHSYHGYDVDDYYDINPEYGTIADLERLCAECAVRGIAVILDIPLNHSSIHNRWFLESISEDSPKHSWYRWANPESDTDIDFNAVIWQHRVWNKHGKNYYSGLYSGGMPDFNHDNPELRDEFKKIFSFWLEKGVSGFRFDAANNFYHPLKLPASADDGLERTIKFWREMCSYIRFVKSDALMVGEVWDAAAARADYMLALPATFHFDLGERITSVVKASGEGNVLAGSSFVDELMNDYDLYARRNPNFIDAPFLSNHDQNRVPLQFKNRANLIKLAASMYLFLPGIPFIYYGEEIGMNGTKPDEQIRTPFIWSNDGSDAKQTAWIVSKYNAKTVGAAEQLKNKNSILNYYRKAVNFRTSNKAMLEGKFAVYDTKNPNIISWCLESETKKAFVFFNLSDDAQVVDTPPQTEKYKIVFAGKAEAKFLRDSMLLPAKSAVVLGN